MAGISEDWRSGWSRYGGIFDPNETAEELSKLEVELAKGGIWSNPSEAHQVHQRYDGLKTRLESYSNAEKKIDEIRGYASLLLENQDPALEQEIGRELRALESEIDRIEAECFLSEEYDHLGAIISLHPGAGGTEAQDWAQMLLRMYLRWSEGHRFKAEIVDMMPGEEAGLKNATVTVDGKYAYGYLKSEKGVHRLVRISPFDSNKRRHTSFASIDVIPRIADDIKVEIRDEDIRIDTFRASGAGGQLVNKTSSAVRITHIPTNIVVQCQNERSQHQNKATAMSVLKAKLFELARQQQKDKISKLRGVQKKIEWGSQIRSYVFQPYTQVKDHRTGMEVHNVASVMDGAVDQFIAAYLRMNASPGKRPDGPE